MVIMIVNDLIYFPQPNQIQKALIFIHGGYWQF